MKSKTKEFIPTNPWNKENGFCFDRTFATRLFSFLIDLKDDMSGAHPMIEEDYEYLLSCAAKLKIWQMSVPSKANSSYFDNLKSIKVNEENVKYLNAIHCPNACDIEKWTSTSTETKPPTTNNYYRTGWVAVNPDGEYKIFSSCPMRQKDKVMVEDKSVWEEDHYGKEYHPEKWNGEYKEYWISSFGNDKGGTIDPENLIPKYQGMTWTCEPKCLN